MGEGEWKGEWEWKGEDGVRGGYDVDGVSMSVINRMRGRMKSRENEVGMCGGVNTW